MRGRLEQSMVVSPIPAAGDIMKGRNAPETNMKMAPSSGSLISVAFGTAGTEPKLSRNCSALR